jgi:hypothetical protein
MLTVWCALASSPSSRLKITGGAMPARREALANATHAARASDPASCLVPSGLDVTASAPQNGAACVSRGRAAYLYVWVR